MAAPVVSGSIALLLAENSSLSPNDVFTYVKNTAVDLGDSGSDQYYGHGRINILDAINSIGEPDTTPPSITVPPNVTLEAPADTTPSNTGTATATDAVDPSPTISHSDAEFLDAQGIGTITRTWTATDYEGNSSLGDQVITIEDTTPLDPSTIHVGDLNWEATNKKNWKALVEITLHDDGHMNVTGVQVQANFTGGTDIFSVNCTTDEFGKCTVEKTTKLESLIFAVDILSDLHHDPDNEFTVVDSIPTVTISKGVNSEGEIGGGGEGSSGGGKDKPCNPNKPGCSS